MTPKGKGGEDDPSVLLDPGSFQLEADRPGRPIVQIDSGPLYELLLSLLVFGHEGDPYRFEVGPDWFSSMRSRASTELLTAIDELDPRCWLWHRLLVLACELRVGRQVLHCTQFTQRLRAMNASRLVELILGRNGHGRVVTPALIEQARAGDQRARSALGGVLFPDEPGEDAALERLLARRPDELKDLLVRVIDGWYSELFKDQEREVAVRLATEARTKRVIGGTTPSRLLRAAATGFHYLPRRGITRVMLIPSIICRPCVLTLRFGSSRVFFYPLAEENDDESSRLVKIHRALADPQRLRILRLLLRSERTLDHLTQELGATRAVVGSQLVLLRDAGLITLSMDERHQTFAIRPNLSSLVFRTLQSYLPSS